MMTTKKTSEQIPQNLEVSPKQEQTKQDGAMRIAKLMEVNTVFENTQTGEFFTSENLARLSAGGDYGKIKTHIFQSNHSQ